MICRPNLNNVKLEGVRNFMIDVMVEDDHQLFLPFMMYLQKWPRMAQEEACT
jgi:hypothetical protein